MESRRSFIRNIFALSLLVVFGRRLRWKVSSAAAAIFHKDAEARRPSLPDDSLVSVERCESYDEDRVYDAVRRSLDALGYEVPSGKSVLLKPNILGQNKPEQCTTTHPAVVGAVCRIFIEKKCTVTIGESSAFYQGGRN